jgi:hypothetical protein
MSITFPIPPIKFSPFHAILKDGIDRLPELIPFEEFTFVVKGECFKTTLSEAVLLSPLISERLKTDPMNREFKFENDELEMKQFCDFLQFIHNREECKFSSEDRKTFLLVCKLLGNEYLTLIFLPSISQFSELPGNVASQEINFCEMNIEKCAAKFSSYSKEELENLPK